MIQISDNTQQIQPSKIRRMFNKALEYDRVPDHALLWLRNLTKGREEQVFRWVGGRQVFLGTMKGG